MLLNWYVGDGTAHKVKKVYLGVNNKARLVYNPEIATIGGLEKVSDITQLVQGRVNIGAASNPNYAIFAGGDDDGRAVYGGTGYSNVEAYTSNLAKSSANNLSSARTNLRGGSIGNYALFAGGAIWGSSGNTPIYDTYSYNTSLVQSTLTSLTTTIRYTIQIKAVTIQNYCLYIRGASNSSYYYSNIIDYYNTSLVKSSLTINKTLGAYSGSANNSYAIYQCVDSSENFMYSISSSLITSVVEESTIINSGATSIGGYSIFCGGYDYSQSAISTAVWGYNSSLTKSNFTNLSTAKSEFYHYSITASKKYAMIGPSLNGSGQYGMIIDVYNSNMTKINDVSFTNARSRPAAATIGNACIFAGGWGQPPVNYVDAWNAKDDSYK